MRIASIPVILAISSACATTTEATSKSNSSSKPGAAPPVRNLLLEGSRIQPPEAFRVNTSTAIVTCNFQDPTPVIFTGTNGTPPDELRASDDPNRPQCYTIEVNAPPGYKAVEGWYTPLHNIQDLLSFAMIAVVPFDDHSLKLCIAGRPGTNARLRVQLHVLCGQ